MKNGEIQFNFQNINFEENKIKDNIFLSKKHLKTGDLIFEDFEDGLNLSGIENKEENHKYIKNSKKNNNNESIDNDFSDDLDNSNDSESSIRELSDDSIQIHFNNKDNYNNNDNQNKFKKKKTKEDLNNTPLPLFDCIYCTDEKIVFGNFINNILSEKYLFLTSVYDMNDLNKLISYQPLIDNNEKNDKLLNIIVKSTEYIKQYIPKENNIAYFKSKLFNNLCELYKADNHRLIKQKFEDSLIRKKKDFYFKGINLISKNSVNNKCLFNSTNSLINNLNALKGFVEPFPINLINLKNSYTTFSGSNNSINFNSLSLNNNEFGCSNNKENNNILDYIVEKIDKKDESANYVGEKDEIMDFFKFDLVRKISKNDISWESEYYDIYNPEISLDYQEENDQENYCDLIKKKNLILNNNKKDNISNQNYYYNFSYVEKKHKKSDNENFIINKSKDNYNKENKPFLEKSFKNNSSQKEQKNNINRIFLKDINTNKSLGFNHFLNKSKSKSFLNQKSGMSHLKSFNSFSTIDNSSNNYRNSLIGCKNIYKYYDNKFNNNQNFIKSVSNQQKSNFNNNYSLGAKIPTKLNISTKPNNFIKYNYSNTGFHFKNRSNIIYDYKIKNKNTNCINTPSYLQNKRNKVYKYKLKNKRLYKNDLKKNKIYNFLNISNLNNNKSNYYMNNYNKKEKNNCKSHNKKISKHYYNDYNLLDSKENKSGLYNTSISNSINYKNNFQKSGPLFSSNAFIINNNKFPQNKSFRFSIGYNHNNINNNQNTNNNKSIFKNHNNSSMYNNYNNLYENKFTKKFYQYNNKSNNQIKLFLKKKKMQSQTYK